MKDDIRHPYQSNTKASTNSNNGEIEVRDLSPVMGRVSVNCRKLVEYAFLLITMVTRKKPQQSETLLIFIPLLRSLL